MKPLHNFCTLFDSNYLTRALLLYQSLERHIGEDFRLYVVCFDELAFQILDKLKLARIVSIKLEEFETPQLQAVKTQRTKGEYCWTCTPHVIRYVLDVYQLPVVTYLDADLYFYNHPSLLLCEFEESGASVLITEHRFTPQYSQSLIYGIYCVQFMTFKSDSYGLTVLQWWQDRCIEWCYSRLEDGKFGDQKYLDDWGERFKGVHVLKHLGGGVAPWNIQQYRLTRRSDYLYVDEAPLVFFHFHAYKYYREGVHAFSPNYLLSAEAVDFLYRPYAHGLLKVHDELRRIDAGFNSGYSTRGGWAMEIAKMIKRKIFGVFNEYKII